MRYVWEVFSQGELLATVRDSNNVLPFFTDIRRTRPDIPTRPLKVRKKYLH